MANMASKTDRFLIECSPRRGRRTADGLSQAAEYFFSQFLTLYDIHMPHTPDHSAISRRPPLQTLSSTRCVRHVFKCGLDGGTGEKTKITSPTHSSSMTCTSLLLSFSIKANCSASTLTKDWYCFAYLARRHGCERFSGLAWVP